jgi:hypothetical protein
MIGFAAIGAVLMLVLWNARPRPHAALAAGAERRTEKTTATAPAGAR